MIQWTREQRYATLVNMIKLLIGDLQPGYSSLESFTEFGYHGYDFNIYTDHINFLQKLNEVLETDYPRVIPDIAAWQALEYTRIFNGVAVRKWMLLNELIVSRYRRDISFPHLIKEEMPNLACLVAFPLLEDIARNISGAWDEEGRLLRDIPESLGLYRIDSKGKTQKHSYKAGQRIVLFSHKLTIMKEALDSGLQKSFNSLDKRLQKPFIAGTTKLLSPLFERLEYHRDFWSHGRKSDGWEAILISLILCILYFRLPYKEQLSQPPAV